MGMRKQAQRRTNRDGRTRIPHSIERRPPSPDSRMQLRRRLREEDQCLERARLHQARRSSMEARTREDDIQTRRYQQQPRSFMEEEDWRTVTHSNKQYRRPVMPEPAKTPISTQQRYEVLSDRDENMEEVEPQPRSTGYAMSEGSIITQMVRSRQHQGGGEASRGEGGRAKSRTGRESVRESVHPYKKNS